MATTAAGRIGRAALGRIIGYALPPRCPGCGVIVTADHSFCLDCWRALDFLAGPACAVCAEPMALAIGPDARCGACMADPPPFDRLDAGVAYGDIARALALKLKHGGRPGIATTMAKVAARRIGALDDDWLIAPVPLHRRRLWTRGYNQAAQIAQALQRQIGGVLSLDLLVRRRATPLLRDMGPAGRARTVAGAFALGGPWQGRIGGRRVLLVDDVYTTGATVRACAKVLRRSGARGVRIACWARVVRFDEDAMAPPDR